MKALKEILTRRNFLDWFIGTGVLLTIYIIGKPLLRFLFPPSKVMESSGTKIALAKRDEIPPGMSKTVLYKNQPALIINTGAGFVALSGVCTHMGCYLEWDVKKKQVVCPCHLASFDTNGNILSGPPKLPLTRYGIEIVDGKIFLSTGL